MKHVVHIVVSPLRRRSDPRFEYSEVTERTRILESTFRSYFAEFPIQNGNNKISYSLRLVHPDDDGFENLVSQPIARSMPRPHRQEHELSWRQRPGSFEQWKSYRATIKNKLSGAFTSEDARRTADVLLREQDEAIMKFDFAHATSVAHAYLQSGADRP